ncbi:hypothetical protein HMPREF1567_3524 [Providencia alcalifaciens PAL-2]|nr:hypothetical protein HMPREF1567_3524 [Providencia alcalifaciens PAL-2]
MEASQGYSRETEQLITPVKLGIQLRIKPYQNLSLSAQFTDTFRYQ